MPIRPEDLLGYICGINTDHEVLVIGIFVKHNSVRLLGPDGSHVVHSSNNFDMLGYKREAALVWNLTDLIDVARDKLDAEDGIQKLAQLTQRAAELKTAAEEKAAKFKK